MTTLRSIEGRVQAWERRLAARQPATPAEADRARFDWYGTSCPCGLEPGECREHPKARLAQRPPEGDWVTWIYRGGRGWRNGREAATRRKRT
jgi:hypothetical protein